MEGTLSAGVLLAFGPYDGLFWLVVIALHTGVYARLSCKTGSRRLQQWTCFGDT